MTRFLKDEVSFREDNESNYRKMNYEKQQFFVRI